MLSIVVPIFNEKDNVDELRLRIKKTLDKNVPYEIIFVDDSTDDTPMLLDELSRKDPHVRYIHREGENGLASAVLKGFSMAEGNNIAVMDGDLQHPPELLLKMYNEIKGGADIVLPSRFINGGEDKGLNAIRGFISGTARYLGKLLLKSVRNISDPTGGYFMLKRQVIEDSKLDPIGWKILMEILVLGKYGKVVEIPYVFDERSGGQSKMSLKVTLQYILHVFSLIFRSEKDRRLFMFLAVGSSGVIVDMVICMLILRIVTNISIAVTISALCAMISNYLLNRNITWKSEKRTSKLVDGFQSIKYFTVCILGIFIKNIVVFLFFNLGLLPLLSNFVGIVFASVLNYFLSNRYVFKGEKKRATYEQR